MRYFKALVGVAVLLFAVWIIVGEQLSRASADATINAPSVLVRSPIEGMLSAPDRQLGSSVVSDTILATVKKDTAIDPRIAQLSRELTFETATLARLQSDQSALQEEHRKLKARSKAYRDGRVATLKLQLAFARARAAILGGKEPTTGHGVAVGRGPGGDTSGALELNRAKERVAVLEQTLFAAEAGTFLGDSFNDLPFSAQRDLQVTRDMADLAHQQEEQKQRVAAVSQQLQEARGAAQMDGTRDIKAATEGIYWQDLAQDGVYVNRGDPIARVVDCNRVIVTASVSELTYQTLHAGQKVRFRALGTNRIFEGYILRLAGTGAATVYESLAVAPTPRHLQRYDVAVAVPKMAADPELQCAIGRTGRVFFQSRPLDWLRDLF